GLTITPGDDKQDLEIEKLTQQTFLFAIFAMVIAISMPTAVTVAAIALRFSISIPLRLFIYIALRLPIRLCSRARGLNRSSFGAGALNNFVQLAPIKPHAAALRTIINFNPLTISHHQGHIAMWTLHYIFSISYKNSARF